MSCGTSFTCGIHRFDKYKFSQQDKPANKELHDENEKRLSNLMQLREQQDKGIFQPVTVQPVTMHPSTAQSITTDMMIMHPSHHSVLYYSISDTKVKKD